MSDFDEELEYFAASRMSHVMVPIEGTSDVGVAVDIGIRVDNIAHARLIADRELHDAILGPILSTESVRSI